MAFPFTPLTTYIANAVPKIKALDLNQIQAYIGHIFSATKTIKSLHLDGTGDAAGGADAGSQRFSAALGASNRILRQQFDSDSGGTNAPGRIYNTSGGTTERTSNARWNAADSKWYRDVAGGNSFLIRETGGFVYALARLGAAADGWIHADWTAIAELNTAGKWHVLGDVDADGGLTAGGGECKFPRPRSNYGTTLTGAHFTISAAWGATATVTATGTDCCGTLDVLSQGAGIGANPTIAHTYTDGTWTFIPAVFFVMRSATDPTDMKQVEVSLTSATGFTAVYPSTPTTGRHYYFNWFVIGTKN